MGILAATIANAWRGKDTRPYKPEDFMPKFGSKEELSPEAVWAKAKAAFGIIKALNTP